MLVSNDFKKIFKKLDIKKNDKIIVHAALKDFGFILNGAQDIIDPLLSLIGKDGTLLCSSNTGVCTDPKYWLNPKIKNYNKARKYLKPFDINLTLPHNRGIIATTFMNYNRVYRSNHPLRSIMAIGKNARYFTKEHKLHDPDGVNSPLYKLYKKNGLALLIGVDLSSCSAIHVAENIADVKYLYKNNCRVLIKNNKKKKFVKLKKISFALNFNRIQNQLEKLHYVKTIKFKSVNISIVKIKESIDYAVQILKKNPDYFLFDLNGNKNVLY